MQVPPQVVVQWRVEPFLDSVAVSFVTIHVGTADFRSPLSPSISCARFFLWVVVGTQKMKKKHYSDRDQACGYPGAFRRTVPGAEGDRQVVRVEHVPAAYGAPTLQRASRGQGKCTPFCFVRAWYIYISDDQTAVERRPKYSSTDFRGMWLTVAATGLVSCSGCALCDVIG